MAHKRTYELMAADALATAADLSPVRTVRPGSALPVHVLKAPRTTLELVHDMITEDPPKRLTFFDDPPVVVPRVIRVSAKTLWDDLPEVKAPRIREDFSSEKTRLANILFWDFLAEDWLMTLDLIQ